MDPSVDELRLVLTVDDFDAAVRLYQEVLGMQAIPAVSSPGGRVVILEAGKATLELADTDHAAYIDEVERSRHGANAELCSTSTTWAVTSLQARPTATPDLEDVTVHP